MEFGYRKLFAAAAAVVVLFAPTAQAAPFAWLSAGPYSSVSGVTTVDFGTSTANNAGPVTNPLSGYVIGLGTYNNGELFNMTTAGISGVSARPVGSLENFWSIQAGETGTVSFSTGIGYYGFLWGSPDTSPWNTVTFLNGSTVLASYGGQDTNLSNDWGNTTYFNVSTGTGPLITSIVFTASQNAFETDNHAYRVAAIPEPETYAMLLAGLGLLGFAARRRKQKELAAS